MRAAFRSRFVQTVQQYPLAGRSPSRTRLYGDAPTRVRAARVVDRRILITRLDGTQATSRALLLIDGPEPIGLEDKLVLPDGSNSPILTMAPVYEPSGLFSHWRGYC